MCAFPKICNDNHLTLKRNYGCLMVLRIFDNIYASKWILCVTDIVYKSTSTAEMQNIFIMLTVIERMDQIYNGLS